MKPLISVVICTRNPRVETLRRVFDALERQTLPKDRWEVVLVDNQSQPPVDPERFEKSFNVRRVECSEPWVTAARVVGVEAAISELVLFVDDDNLLAADYLEQAIKIGVDRPYLGAWGGSNSPEFETDPPPWISGYASCFAVREVARDYWGNSLESAEAHPAGAGMCFRRAVGLRWAAEVKACPYRKELGSRNGSLHRGEDTDLAFTACGMGMGIGVFHHLKLTHIVSRARLSLGYAEGLLEGVAHCFTLLKFIHANEFGRPPQSRFVQALDWIKGRYSMSEWERRLQAAMDRGREKAFAFIEKTRALQPVDPRMNE